jgi:limonene-1,2-epoxide hydrolase
VVYICLNEQGVARAKKTLKNMKPKEVLQKWIDAFNKADLEMISDLYADKAINHQVANEPVEGKSAIKKMFEDEFATAEMTCIPENIFEDGEWAILEWKDPNGLRGCGFFQIQNDKIIFQRGYWDKLSFLKLHINISNDPIL